MPAHDCLLQSCRGFFNALKGFTYEMQYPARPPFFAHKFVRLLMKSCAAMDIGQSACLLICYIVHTEDAVRYSGPVRFWNEQLMTVMGFKSPKQLNEARSRAEGSGWLVYERSGNRQVGRYWVTIPDGYEGLDDSPIEENHSVNHSEYGTNSGINTEWIAERIGDGSRNEKVTESGKPSNPIPDPIPIYSPGNDVLIPESMNRPEVLQTVQAWFRHLIVKQKPEKIPDPNSPQEQAFWQRIAKYGPDRFIEIANHTMSEGWVGFREPEVARREFGGKQNGSHLVNDDWICVLEAIEKFPSRSREDIEGRKKLLGPERFEAMKRIGSGRIAESNDYEKNQTLKPMFLKHLEELRHAPTATSG